MGVSFHIVNPVCFIYRELSIKLLLLLPLLISITVCYSQPYKHQRCSSRLENALEHMRRRSAQVTRAGKSFPAETPYTVYHSLYGGHNSGHDNDDEDFYHDDGRGGYGNYFSRNKRQQFPVGFSEQFASLLNKRQPHKLAVSRVEVEDLKVKMPSKPAARWVEIQGCKFNRENSTLDTRLIFPDLTISGRVILQPTGGNCNMILRLRHAGIEFHTTPIGFDIGPNEESRRLGAATVRTDSHFAEPGFISVFAHGCQGPTGIRLRQNNNRRRFGTAGPFAPDIEISDPQIVMGTSNSNRWGRYQHGYDVKKNYNDAGLTSSYQRDKYLNIDGSKESNEFYNPNEDNFYRRHFRYKRDLRHRPYLRPDQDDQIVFEDDILNISDDFQNLIQPDARAFANVFSVQGGNHKGQPDRDVVNDAFTNELEKLFSMGVRGLLTTYMQRALQPAIKETLMENMGYTLSYG